MAQIITKRYTNIIIDGTLMQTQEENVREFEIEVAIDGGEAIFKTLIIPVKKLNDFVSVGTTKEVISGFEVGTVYSFRTRNILNNGSKSLWSPWANETAGDVTNDMTFLTVEVNESSTAVEFVATVDAIKDDFEKFEWKIETAIVDSLLNPSEPNPKSTPNINAIPDFVTTAVDKISLSFNENRETWWFAWIRAVDQSGNIGPDGWKAFGYGRVLPMDLQTDGDNEPPDNTNYTNLDFIENIIPGTL